MLRTLLQAQGLLTERVELEQRNTGEVDIEAIRARLAAKSVKDE